MSVVMAFAIKLKPWRVSPMAVSLHGGILFVGVLTMRALLY